MRSKAILTVLAAGVTFSAQSQQRQADTSLGATTIEVIQSYKPEVRQVPRPEVSPDLPPRDTSSPEVHYQVPQQTLYFTYSARPIRPLALDRDSINLPFSNYVKLGGGNLSTLYLDAGLVLAKGKDFETTLHLHHLSQSGELPHQAMSRSGFEAEGSTTRFDHIWKLRLDGLHNRVHYYGYDRTFFEYEREDLLQTFTGADINLSVRPADSGMYNLNYAPQIGLYIYNDRWDASETGVQLQVPVSYHLSEELRADLGVSASLVKLTRSGNSIDNNQFQIRPAIAFDRGNFSLHAGLYPSFGSGGYNYLLPDLRLRYQIPQSQAAVTVGWQGHLQQNTYKHLSAINPFINPAFEAGFQTRVTEAYALLESNIGEHLKLSGKISLLEWDQMPIFLNDTGDFKSFRVVYPEDVKAVGLEGTVRYDIGKLLSVGASVIYRHFWEPDNVPVFHVPGIRARLDVAYTPLKDLTVTGYATILDKIHAISRATTSPNPFAGETIRLNGVFDLGFGAEYQFIPRLSGFLNVNNLLNNDYQRWYRYPAYGFNIFGGVRFKF